MESLINVRTLAFDDACDKMIYNVYIAGARLGIMQKSVCRKYFLYVFPCF
jgi:hypothetical protein